MKSNATKILVLIWVLGLLFSAITLRAQVSGATLSAPSLTRREELLSARKSPPRMAPPV